jgi:hypothetical protein
MPSGVGGADAGRLRAFLLAKERRTTAVRLRPMAHQWRWFVRRTTKSVVMWSERAGSP